eukprot:691656-Pelagomonas_calceolata.AAC.1
MSSGAVSELHGLVVIEIITLAAAFVSNVALPMHPETAAAHHLCIVCACRADTDAGNLLPEALRKRISRSDGQGASAPTSQKEEGKHDSRSEILGEENSSA